MISFEGKRSISVLKLSKTKIKVSTNFGNVKKNEKEREMGLPVKLRWSESVPNLFSDWNNLENEFCEFVFDDPKIVGSQTSLKSQKRRKTKSLIGSDIEDFDVDHALDCVSR